MAIAGRDGQVAEQERFLLRIDSVPGAAPRVRVRRASTGAEAHTVGLDDVPNVISALLAPAGHATAAAAVVGHRVAAAAGVGPGEQIVSGRIVSGVDAQLGVRLERGPIRQGEPFTIEIILVVDAVAVALPTARCAVSVFARPIAPRHPATRNGRPDPLAAAAAAVSIGRPGTVLVAGSYRLETVVQLTELLAGQVRHLAAAFAESVLVVSPAPGLRAV